MYYSGWAPLLTLQDWDATPVDHLADSVPSAAGMRTLGGTSALPAPSSQTRVVQDYLGRGVSLLRFRGLQAHDDGMGHTTSTATTGASSSPGVGARHGHQRAAEVFAATHKRFHIKTRAALPRHAGLVYVECQIASAGGASEGNEEEEETNGNKGDGVGSAKSRAARTNGAAQRPVSSSSSPLPLVVGVCTGALPTHVLPGEGAGSVGFLTASRTVYAHGRPDPERASFALDTFPPLRADGAWRRDRPHRTRTTSSTNNTNTNNNNNNNNSNNTADKARDPNHLHDDAAEAEDVDSDASDHVEDGQEVYGGLSATPSLSHDSRHSPASPPQRGLQVGDTVGCLVNMDDGTVRFVVNGQILADYVGQMPTDSARRDPAPAPTARTTTTSAGPVAYFFAVGVTQRTTHDVTLRVVLQAGLNACPRIPLPLRATMPPHRHEHGQTRGRVVSHRRHVNVVFPLHFFVLGLGAHDVHARQQQQQQQQQQQAGSSDADDLAPTTRAVPGFPVPPSPPTRPTMSKQACMDWLVGTPTTTTTTTNSTITTMPLSHSGTIASVAARMDDPVSREERALSGEAATQLLERHMALRGMYRAAEALVREGAVLGLTSIPTPLPSASPPLQARMGSPGTHASFAHYMAALRDTVLTGVSSQGRSNPLLAVFLSHTPLSETVERRVQQCAQLVRDTHHSTPSTHTVVGAAAAASSTNNNNNKARQLALYVLARDASVFFLLCVMPLVESVLTTAASLLMVHAPYAEATAATAEAEDEEEKKMVACGHAALSPSTAWASFCADVLGPVEALVAAPVSDASATHLRLQQQFFEALAATTTTTTDVAISEFSYVEAMPWLLQAALTSSVSSSSSSGPPDTAARRRVALGEALVALLECLLSATASSISISTSTSSLSVDRAKAAQRLVHAARLAIRRRVWQRLCHALEGLNEHVLLVLARWMHALTINADEEEEEEEEEAEGEVEKAAVAGGAEEANQYQAVDEPPYAPTPLPYTRSHGDPEEEEEAEEEVLLDAEGDLYSEQGSYELEGFEGDSDDGVFGPFGRVAVPEAEAEDGEEGEGEVERPLEAHARDGGIVEPATAQAPSHPHPSVRSRPRNGRHTKRGRSSGAPRRLLHRSCSLPRDVFFPSIEAPTAASLPCEEARDVTRSDLGMQTWSALSLRSGWRRVHVIAALQPDAYASTRAFIAQWCRSEKALTAGATAVPPRSTCRPSCSAGRGQHAFSQKPGFEAEADDDDDARAFTGADASFLKQLEALLRTIYDLL